MAVNLIPNMTSNTAPSGVAFASSFYDAGASSYGGFSYNNTVGWITNGTGVPCHLGYQFVSAKIVNSYQFYPWDLDNFNVRCPKDWIFQGSNDGVTYTNLHTVTGFTGYAVNTPVAFSFENSTSYLYYRIYITANVGANAYTGLRRFEMYSNTPKALLHFDGTNGSTSFVDSSVYSRVVTSTGSGPVISTAVSKFGGSSVYFNGTGRLQVGSAGDFNLSTYSALTIDFWINTTNLNGNILNFDNFSASAFLDLFMTNGFISARVRNGNGGVDTKVDATTAIASGVTTHFAAVWDTTTHVTLYVNGVASGSGALPALPSTQTNTLFMGYNNYNGGVSDPFTGYIDELRVNDFAAYSANFTPSTLAYSNPPAPLPKALLHFDGTSGSTTITNSGTGSTLTNSGVTLSNTVSKFGGSSAYFNGSSYLSHAGDAEYDMGTGDFRFEAWIYLTLVNGAYQQLFDSLPYGVTSNPRRGLTINPSGVLCVASDGSVLTTGNTVSINTWHHCVYQRRSGIVEAYYDGVRTEILTGDTTNVSRNSILVGVDGYTSSTFHGYMDEVVVDSGLGSAIYSANFTPPTSAYGSGGSIPDVTSASTSSQSNQSASSSGGISVYSFVSTNQVQTVLSAGSILYYLNVVVAQSNESVAFLADVGTSSLTFTGQSNQFFTGSLSSAIVGSFITSQSNQATLSSGLVGNPIAASVITGQSNQKSLASLNRVITGSTATGQTFQSTAIIGIFSYFGQKTESRTKTAIYQSLRNLVSIDEPKSTVWIMEKKHINRDMLD